jgi:hypothetical protein
VHAFRSGWRACGPGIAAVDAGGARGLQHVGQAALAVDEDQRRALARRELDGAVFQDLLAHHRLHWNHPCLPRDRAFEARASAA